MVDTQRNKGGFQLGADRPLPRAAATCEQPSEPSRQAPRADRAEPIDFKSGDGLGWKIIDATTALLSLCSSNVVDLLDPRRDYCRRGRSVRDGPPVQRPEDWACRVLALSSCKRNPAARPLRR